MIRSLQKKKKFPGVDIDKVHKNRDAMNFKLSVRELPKLRKSAENAPMCFSCGNVNRGGNLVLAHSNELALGRGSHFKTPDYFGAILCQECHDQVDGRSGNLTKESKHEMHKRAHEKTLTWWFEAGLLK